MDGNRQKKDMESSSLNRKKNERKSIKKMKRKRITNAHDPVVEKGKPNNKGK